MEKFGALDSKEKTIAILGDKWWPQMAKVLCNLWEKRNGRLNVGSVY